MRKIVSVLVLICMMLAMASCDKAVSGSTDDLGVIHEPEFGGIYIKITIDDFNSLGFEYGDSVDITFSNGYQYTDIPYHNGFYVEPGCPLLIAYPGYDYIKVVNNLGDDAFEVAGLSENDTAKVVLHEHGKYISEQQSGDISYHDDRSMYPGDAVFANFRSCKAGDLKTDILYRSASPADNKHNRANYADRLAEHAGIRYILDLADSTDNVMAYMASEDFDSPYFKSLYDEGNVGLYGLTANYKDDVFKKKIAAGFVDLSQHEGPYLVNCTEGKDRTGFAVMLLEALSGATYDEIVEDYMITYFNYYGIARFNEEDRYYQLKENNLDVMLRYIAGDSNADLEHTDFGPCAEAYLKSAGMTDGQIALLKSRLTG